MVRLDAGRRGGLHARPPDAAAGRRLLAEGRHAVQRAVRARPAHVDRRLLDRAAQASGPVVRPGAVHADVPVSAAAVPPPGLGPAVLLPGQPGRAGDRRGGGRVRVAGASAARHLLGRDPAAVAAPLGGERGPRPARDARKAEAGHHGPGVQPPAPAPQDAQAGRPLPTPRRLVRVHPNLQLRRPGRGRQEDAGRGVPPRQPPTPRARPGLEHGRLQPAGRRVRGRGDGGRRRSRRRGAALPPAPRGTGRDHSHGRRPVQPQPGDRLHEPGAGIVPRSGGGRLRAGLGADPPPAGLGEPVAGGDPGHAAGPDPSRPGAGVHPHRRRHVPAADEVPRGPVRRRHAG